MKLVVLYRPKSEHARRVEEFLRDLQMQHTIAPGDLKVVDCDSREGISTSSIYDIMTWPAILVTDDVGGYIQSWVGSDLPMMRDVAAYISGVAY